MVKFAVVLFAVGLNAQQGPPTVRASGEATVTVAPDEARINIGVVTQAPTAEAAGAENARRAEAVVTRLRALLGASGEVKTINYSISPNYDYQAKAPPVITGYTANNTVQVRIDHLEDTGKVIDAVTQNGANAINGIQFMLKDDRAVRAEALGKAAEQAKTNAEAIASALGLEVTGVVSAETGEAVTPRPIYTMMATQARASTPVSPGTIDVHATVTVTLAVKQ
jgi:uncharacterized protein YggE